MSSAAADFVADLLQSDDLHEDERHGSRGNLNVQRMPSAFDYSEHSLAYDEMYVYQGLLRCEPLNWLIQPSPANIRIWISNCSRHIVTK
jgi:hypothetical protein